MQAQGDRADAPAKRASVSSCRNRPDGNGASQPYDATSSSGITECVITLWWVCRIVVARGSEGHRFLLCCSGVSDRANKEQSELLAAAAVAQALDAKLLRRDLPGTQQTRDFDLVFADGRDPEPLEVTTFASRPDIETSKRLDRLDEEIPAPELNRDWVLDLGAPITGQRTRPLDVLQIERDVVELLAALEAGGYESIDYGLIGRDPAVSAELQRLSGLGVDAGYATSRAEGDTANVMLVAPVGGFGHADLVAAGIEAEARKVDNQKKLGEPPNALRRHLVVIFDGSTGPAFVAAYQGSSGRLPCLPHPITTAWACAGASLLGTTPPDGWVHFRIPERILASPKDRLLV